MTVTANVHRAERMAAKGVGEYSWLDILTPDGSVSVFMPQAAAEATAAAFNDAMAAEAEGALTLADFVEAEK